MERLFVSPHLIDVILGFTVVEAVLLFVWLRRRASGAQRAKTQAWVGGERPDGTSGGTDVKASALMLPIGLMLLPGICLMAAIRASLAGMAWPWVPAALAAALVAHVLDLRNRWRA